MLFIICLFFLIECIATVFETADAADKNNWQDTKVTVLVLADNEEVLIGSTLEKLTPAKKKKTVLKLLVQWVQTVIERHDIERKGKGYALDYGLQFIESDPPDVVVRIDADCTVYEDAIALMRPIQATYLMVQELKSVPSPDSKIKHEFECGNIRFTCHNL